ncbi:MAG: methyltransferase [Pirellulaceae bacterium]|nr:methyltransferase [Pirellulaceae bacterium]
MIETSNTSVRLPARIEEQRLIEIAMSLPGQKIGAVSVGRGQAAEQLAIDRSDAEVVCWYLDGYQANLAKQHVDPLPNLTIACEADWPAGECDLTIIPISKGGEAELTRDVLQSAYHHLVIGGYLVASVDNPQDRWLHEQLKNYEKSVKVRSFEDAIVYFIQKTTELKKIKDFTCELSFRDCEATIRLITRPGVFSHRQLDNGTRQILDAIDVFPEAKLVDIGCGSGAIALGMAARDPSAKIVAFDSNARAVWCAKQGAVLNGFENVDVGLNCTGEYGMANQFDMALANPPYFADFRIARLFIDAAKRSLRPGGRLVVVTKQPKWYEENMPELFNDVEVFESRRYHIASGTKAMHEEST